MVFYKFFYNAENLVENRRVVNYGYFTTREVFLEKLARWSSSLAGTYIYYESDANRLKNLAQSEGISELPWGTIGWYGAEEHQHAINLD